MRKTDTRWSTSLACLQPCSWRSPAYRWRINMPTFFYRPNMQEGLMGLIARLQAERADQIARGIESAAGSLGHALGVRGQESRQQAAQESSILARLAESGSLEIPTGTVAPGGKKVWDAPSPGSIS